MTDPAETGNGATAPAAENAAKKLMEQVLAKDLKHVVICYATENGDAQVVASPMPITAMNDFSRLLDLRVNREYVTRMAPAQARSPTQPARGGAASRIAEAVAASLPAKARHQVLERTKNLAKLAAKQAKGGKGKAAKTAAKP